MNTKELIIELGHVRLLVAAGQTEAALGVLASLQRAQRERLREEEGIEVSEAKADQIIELLRGACQ